MKKGKRFSYDSAIIPYSKQSYKNRNEGKKNFKYSVNNYSSILIVIDISNIYIYIFSN